MTRLWIALLLILAAPLGYGQLWNGTLASSRGYDWQHNAGIAGSQTVPSASWSQCSGGTISPYGSSGSPASPATINNAIQAHLGGNCYVLLGNGDFYLDGAIENTQSSGTTGGVELRGGGPTNTTLHFCYPNTGSGGACPTSNGYGCASGRGSCMLGFSSNDGTYGGGTPSFANWTAGYSQGATSITVDNGSSLFVGQMLVLDQCDDGYTGATNTGQCSGGPVDTLNYYNCEAKYSGSSTSWSTNGGCSENGPDNATRGAGATNYNRGQQEMVQVSSCSPTCGTSGTTVVTISHPLVHPNWRSGQSPQVWWITPMINTGFQGFSIDGTTWNTSASFGIAFNNVAGFWVRQVAMTNFPDISLFAAQSMDFIIEQNYIYNMGQSNPSYDSTGISLFAFNGIVQNNILQKGHVAIVPFGPVVATVIGYNYAINATTGDGYNFGNFWTGHSSGSDYDLYEGNFVNQILGDQTHGTQNAETIYRNFMSGYESCGNGQCGSNTVKQNNNWGVEDSSANRYWNMIANVVGTPNISTVGYVYTNNSYIFYSSAGLGYAYELASGNQSVSNAFPIDPYLIPTTYRWGNWDAYNGSTQWNTSEVPSGISVYPQSVPTTTCTSSIACVASFYLGSMPSWWSNSGASIPWPGIGPDVSSGNVGQCGGSFPPSSGQVTYVAATNASQCDGQGLTAAWANHINPNPAMACYLAAGGAVDGSSSAITFNPATCYGTAAVASKPKLIGVRMVNGKVLQ